MKSKTAMMAVLGMFVLPALLAWVVLKFELYNAGQTNKGEFLSMEVGLADLPAMDEKKGYWNMVYVLPETCDQYCDNMLYVLRQGYVALGKLQGDVRPVVLTGNHDADAYIEKYPELMFLPTTNSETNQIERLNSQHLYLADPFGQVILQYEGVADRQDMIIKVKDVLADVKRLIKYSRA